MDFSIIITTYNRPVKVTELVDRVIDINALAAKIFIVDSSDKQNELLIHKVGITYLVSLHKNQPYQRYLGFLASDTEFLIFLDDDMEICDKEFIIKLEQIFKDQSIVGIAINFKNKHKDSLLAQIPQTKLFEKQRLLKRIKGFLSGYPHLPDGKFGLCGNRGRQPSGGGPTEWVSGGAFAVRRKAMFQNFNFQLFDIFEEGLGMGEDGIIGYGLSKQGTLVYHDELFFLHNDQNDSLYTSSTLAFARRVAFSRLYLSLEKSRLDKRKYVWARLHYHYYMVWRILGLFLNFILKPEQSRKVMLKGTISGWLMTFDFSFDKELTRHCYWQNEANIALS